MCYTEAAEEAEWPHSDLRADMWTDQDDDHKANEQEHQHHGVDDGQPVDLQQRCSHYNHLQANL